MTNGGISTDWFKSTWNAAVLSPRIQPISSEPVYNPLTPNERVMNALGSNHNKGVLLLCHRDINLRKHLSAMHCTGIRGCGKDL